MEESRSESIVFTIFIGTLDGNLVCPCNDLRLGQVLGEGSRTGQGDGTQTGGFKMPGTGAQVESLKYVMITLAGFVA